MKNILVLADISVAKNGASKVTNRLVELLGQHYRVRVVDTAIFTKSSSRFLRKICIYIREAFKIRASIFRRHAEGARDCFLYLQMGGMATTLIQILFLKIVSSQVTKSNIFLHHHSSKAIKSGGFFVSFTYRQIIKLGTSIYLTPGMRHQAEVKFGKHQNVIISNAASISVSGDDLLDIRLESLAATNFNLIHFGTLSKEKGTLKVIELSETLATKFSNAKAYIFGYSNDDETRITLEKYRQPEGKIFYHGSYSFDELLFLREKIGLFLFLSNYEHEAAPLVIYEAMSLGCVPIVNDSGYCLEIIQGRGYRIYEGSDLRIQINELFEKLMTEPKNFEIFKQLRADNFESLKLEKAQAERDLLNLFGIQLK